MYIPKLYKNISFETCMVLYGFLMEADILKRITHCDSYAIYIDLYYVAHCECQTMFRITFTGLNSHMYLLLISEL